MICVVALGHPAPPMNYTALANERPAVASRSAVSSTIRSDQIGLTLFSPNASTCQIRSDRFEPPQPRTCGMGVVHTIASLRVHPVPLTPTTSLGRKWTCACMDGKVQGPPAGPTNRPGQHTRSRSRFGTGLTLRCWDYMQTSERAQSPVRQPSRRRHAGPCPWHGAYVDIAPGADRYGGACLVLMQVIFELPMRLAVIYSNAPTFVWEILTPRPATPP